MSLQTFRDPVSVHTPHSLWILFYVYSTNILIQKNILYLLARLSTNEAQTPHTEEEKAILIQGIINSTLKMMERIITSKSPKKCARDSAKPYQQSKTAITKSTIFLNTLTNNQKLPARPRDFRASLADEEKSIGMSELSDILSAMVRHYLLEPKRSNLLFPRGRPKSDTRIVDERRGRFSYYQQSNVKGIIDEVIKDSDSINKIDNAVLNSEIFYRFLKYSFETYLYQMKENEKAFLNSMRGTIIKYGLKDKKDLDSSDILARDLTPETIKRLSKGYAINTMKKFQQDRKNILYTVGALFFLLKVYPSGMGEKM